MNSQCIHYREIVSTRVTSYVNESIGNEYLYRELGLVNSQCIHYREIVSTLMSGPPPEEVRLRYPPSRHFHAPIYFYSNNVHIALKAFSIHPKYDVGHGGRKL